MTAAFPLAILAFFLSVVVSVFTARYAYGRFKDAGKAQPGLLAIGIFLASFLSIMSVFIFFISQMSFER